jgi:hypothetical protein
MRGSRFILFFGGLLGSAGGSPPAGSPYTMTAGAGSFLLSGETMTPLVDFRIPADVGAFALTGIAATLSTTATDSREFAGISTYLNTDTSRSFAAFDQYVVA